MNSLNQEANVLIVDDVSSNLVLLSEMIERAGYVARPVVSVKQALKAIEVSLPQLILLDVSMPDINGFELCRMLKKRHDTRNVPIIFISALDSTIDKMKGFEAGAVDYISKPFEVEEVTMRINTHMRLCMLQREMKIQNERLQRLIREQMHILEENQNYFLWMLNEIICIRFPNQREHIKKVAMNAKVLAMSLQFSNDFHDQITDEFVRCIEPAAMIHNIELLVLSDDILERKDHLSIQECKEIYQTMSGSFNRLEKMFRNHKEDRCITMALNIVKYQHECFDGSGFPCGAKQEDIPLEARIVSVVDTYSSMQSNKNDSALRSQKERIDWIVGQAGQKFDPKIIAVFAKIANQLK